MSTRQNPNSRLRELVESTEYQKDFKDLKKSILELKSPKKRKAFIIKEGGVGNFTEVDSTKSIKTRIIHRELIPLKRVQSLLKNGNINEHWVEIPSVYKDFETKYGLNFLLDPAQPYQLRLDPFVPPLVWSFGSDTIGTKIKMMIDISYPTKVLENSFKMALRNLKKMWNLKAGRKERYSDKEVYEVRKLQREGLNGMDIYRRWYPKSKFNPNKDYICGEGFDTVDGKRVRGTDVDAYDGWKNYKRILRLIERVETRKP